MFSLLRVFFVRVVCVLCWLGAFSTKTQIDERDGWHLFRYFSLKAMLIQFASCTRGARETLTKAADGMRKCELQFEISKSLVLFVCVFIILWCC